jgi:hypothetical protein
MSFNRNIYDVCSYDYQLAETVGPGVYQLARPDNGCTSCLPADPRIIAQSKGVSVSRNTSMIDIDSELIGISRNLTRCPDRKYVPDTNASGQCGAQTGKVRTGCQSTAKLCVDDSEKMHFTDCGMYTEDTRLSNPPCTLRGTGWNRWEWLPMNPQERVTEPFDFKINTKLLSKDSHRPCIPRPVDQHLVYPMPKDIPICETIMPVCTVPTMPASVSWQREEIVSRY